MLENRIVCFSSRISLSASLLWISNSSHFSLSNPSSLLSSWVVSASAYRDLVNN